MVPLDDDIAQDFYAHAQALCAESARYEALRERTAGRAVQRAALAAAASGSNRPAPTRLCDGLMSLAGDNCLIWPSCSRTRVHAARLQGSPSLPRLSALHLDTPPPATGGWFTSPEPTQDEPVWHLAGKKKGKGTQKVVSFVDALALPYVLCLYPLPPPSDKEGILTRDQLEALTIAQIARNFSVWFNKNLRTRVLMPLLLQLTSTS
jgi:hypothetical protein